jgi:hypothetical protein
MNSTPGSRGDLRHQSRRRRVRHGLVAALVAFGLTVVPAHATQDASPVLLDRHLTVGAGATVTTTVADAIARAEEAIVPARLLAERGLARRIANVTYRVSKLLLFDIPQEQWLVVANHEVMGHGARLRERFDGSISYTVDPPAPYGPGGGATFFRFDREPTRHELLAVSAAGMEADAVAARVVAERVFRRGRLRPRDAIRYLAFELDTLTYILSTGDGPEREGHDVSAFLQTYNGLAAAAGAGPLTARTLRREVLVSLANPMLGFAAYGIGRYLWTGAADARVPALPIGKLRYLPLVRYQLTPYGTEWALANYVAGGRWPTRIEVRFGRAPGTRPWGIGAERRELASWRSWRLDAGADLWRQPAIAERADPTAQPLRFGMAMRGRLERPLLPVWFSPRRATIVIDIGGKTAGFVPGEPIGGGLVVRAGVGIPLN